MTGDARHDRGAPELLGPAGGELVHVASSADFEVDGKPRRKKGLVSALVAAAMGIGTLAKAVLACLHH